MGESLVTPKLPVKHEHMRFFARALGKQIGQFSWQMKMALAKYQEGILDKQYVQARLGDIATELFMASCVYSRMTGVMINGTIPEPDKEQEFKTGRLYLRLAQMRNEKRFDELKINLDEEMEAVADVWLKETFEKDWVNKPEGEVTA